MAPRVATVRTMRGTDAKQVIASAASDHPRASVFETRPWFMAWWASFGRDEQTIAIVADDGVARWVVPLFVDARDGGPKAHWLGHPFVDRATVLGRAPLPSSVASGLAEALAGLGVPVELDALDLSHESTVRLLRTLATDGWEVIYEACPVLTLGGRVGRSATNVTRFSRRFPSMRARLTSGRALTQPVVEDFVQRRQQRWRADGRWDELPDMEGQPDFIELFGTLIDTLAQHGSARLFQLEVDDVVLAEDLYLGGPAMPLLYFRSYNREFASRSPGRVLLDQCIVLAAEAGCEAIDLGRGGEQYKFDLGADESNVAAAIWQR